MNKKIGLFVALVFMSVCVFSNKAFAFEDELTIMQELGSIRYDKDGASFEGKGHGEFSLSKDKPEFTVAEDDVLRTAYPIRPRKSPYTYYGYSIRYTDNTYELRQDRTLNYDELKQHQKDVNNPISFIIIYYGPTSIIQVNYNLLKEDDSKELLLTDEQYGKFDTSYMNLFEVKGESLSLNKLMSDYITINHDSHKIKYIDEDQIINIDLRLPKITIKYQDEQGKTLKDSVVKIGKVADLLAVDSPNIKGYDYTHNISDKVNFKNKDQELILIYSSKVEGSVNVRYMTEDGKEIAQRVTKSDYVGENYDSTSKKIPGYDLILTPINASGTYSEGVTFVDYIYKKNVVLPEIEGQVIVKYVDENNNEIASRTNLSGFLGERYATSAKVISGYDLVQEPEEACKNGVFTEGVTELTYQYKSIDTPIEKIEGHVLVNYVDGEGNAIASQVELSNFVGTAYQTAAKEIKGYKLKSDSGNTAGNIAEGVQVVTYVYEKIDTGIPDVEGFVNVHFVDSQNKNIAESLSLSGVVGSSYDTAAKEISGYDLIQVPDNGRGLYTEGVQEVIYVYQKKNTPIPDIEGHVETKYTDETGKNVALSESLSGKVGTNYTTKSKEIPGYKLVTEPTNKEGQITEGTITVTYVYKQVKTEETVEGKVITKYIDDKGKEIALSETDTNTVGESYTTQAKKIPGYDLITTPENALGTFAEGTITVTYVYKEKKAEEIVEGKVITKYIDDKGKEIALSETKTNTVGESYTTQAKKIPGYDLITTPENALGTFAEGTITVTYVYKGIKDVKVTDGKVIAKFIDQDGNVLSEEVVTTGKIGSNYQTSKKSITGYNLLKVEGKEAGTYIEGTQEVVYIYSKSNIPPIIKPVIKPIVPPIKPISPITPVTPITPTSVVNPSGNLTSSKGTLPKTGETTDIRFSLMGIVLSMSLFLIFYKNYKKELFNQ